MEDCVNCIFEFSWIYKYITLKKKNPFWPQTGPIVLKTENVSAISFYINLKFTTHFIESVTLVHINGNCIGRYIIMYLPTQIEYFLYAGSSNTCTALYLCKLQVGIKIMKHYCLEISKSFATPPLTFPVKVQNLCSQPLHRNVAFFIAGLRYPLHINFQLGSSLSRMAMPVSSSFLFSSSLAKAFSPFAPFGSEARMQSIESFRKAFSQEAVTLKPFDFLSF